MKLPYILNISGTPRHALTILISGDKMGNKIRLICDWYNFKDLTFLVLFSIYFGDWCKNDHRYSFSACAKFSENEKADRNWESVAVAVFVSFFWNVRWEKIAFGSNETKPDLMKDANLIARGKEKGNEGKLESESWFSSSSSRFVCRTKGKIEFSKKKTSTSND